MIELWTNKGNIDVLMDIWLNTNVEAHAFISSEYWTGNYELVKSMLPEADWYTFSQDEKIIGFAGIVDASYIAGIFVRKEWQSKGVGKALLDVCKTKYSRLTLAVYEKNQRAIVFYKNNGFTVVSELVDDQTGETEYHMEWSK